MCVEARNTLFVPVIPNRITRTNTVGRAEVDYTRLLCEYGSNLFIKHVKGTETIRKTRDKGMIRL